MSLDINILFKIFAKASVTHSNNVYSLSDLILWVFFK